MLLSNRIDRRPGVLARSLAGSLARRLRIDSLLRNSIYVMSSTAVTATSGYLYWMMATHIYHPADVGLASALVATVMLASTVASLGTVPTLIQVLPRRETGYPWSLTLNAVLIAGTVASLLTGGIAAVLLPQLSPRFTITGHQIGYAISLVVGVPLMTLVGLLDAAFVAERAAGSALAQTVVFGVLRIPFLVLPLLLGQTGALVICASWSLAAGAGVVGGALLVPRLGRSYRLAIRGIGRQLRSILSSLAGQQLISLGALAPMYLLPVIVTARLSPTENAYFYTTWQVGSIFFVVSSSVGVSLFAEGSYEPSSVVPKARDSALIIGVLLVPAMLFALLGGHLILSTFGPAYALNGYALLAILIASAVPDAITNVYIAVLRVQRRLRRAAMLNLSMAALTLILAWILLPRLGIAGGGWAWLIAQTAGSVVVVVACLMAAGAGWKRRYRRGHPPTTNVR
jgi:O-antigen/teichoic acid export membrane protein